MQAPLREAPPVRRWLRVGGRSLVTAVLLYIVLAYVVTPLLWLHYEHHPALAAAPKTSTTAEGIPGDPLNVGFVGTREELIRAMVAAGWSPADPITLRSSLGIVESVLLDRPDPSAPVSSLYLWGRPQDLAFERQVGGSARERHHVRLWSAPELGTGDRPLWLGAATFDVGVGISHRTGQITHHIAADIDVERDRLIGDLESVQQLTQVYQATGVGATWRGFNGGGDWYYTDGELTIGVLAVNNTPQATPPARPANPPAVALKNRVWSWLRELLARR